MADLNIPSSVNIALANLVNATRDVHISNLAAAMITASPRAYSIKEVLELHRDLHFALYPSTNSGSYKEWEKTKDETLTKYRG